MTVYEMDQPLIPTAEAAKRLGVSKTTVLNWMNDGTLKWGYRHRKSKAVYEDSLEECLYSLRHPLDGCKPGVAHE